MTILLNVPPDGSSDEAARYLAEILRVEFGLKVHVLKGEKIPSDRPPRVIIALGCMADNPFIRSLYLRFRTIVDRWYPGEGGYVLQSFHPAGEHEPRVLIAGGSNQEGVMAAARALAGLWRRKGKPDTGWILQVRLGREHLLPPTDRMECFPIADSVIGLPDPAPNTGLEKPGYTGGSIRHYLLLLGMYGPHADNMHFSRSSQLALRFLYTGRDDDGKRYRDRLMDEIGQGIIARLYHYKSLRMFQLWELLGPSPFFSEEDRSVVNNAIQDYLINGTLFLHKKGANVSGDFRRLSTRKGLFNRHFACGALNLLVGSDYFYRFTGKTALAKSRWMEYRKMAAKFFRSQAGTDVPYTGLTEGYFSYLEVMLESMLIACPEKISKDPHIRLWAERCVGLCTNQGVMVTGPQSPEDRYGYNLLRKLAYLLNDGRYLYVADLRERAVRRGMDRVFQFSAGQAWAAGVLPEEPNDAIGLKVFPLNERSRKCAAPEVPKNRGFDRAVGRSGWTLDDEYFVVPGIRGTGKIQPNIGSLAAYERFGVRCIRSPENQLLAMGNNPWGFSTVTVTHDGVCAALPSGAILLDRQSRSGLEFLTLKMACGNVYDWHRTFCWRREGFLIVADMIHFRKAGAFTASANWRCTHPMTTKDNRAWCDNVSPEGVRSRFWIETSVACFLSDDMARRQSDKMPGLPDGLQSGDEVVLHAMTDGTAAPGECVHIYTLLHAARNTRQPEYHLKPTRNGVKIEGLGTIYSLKNLTSGNTLTVRRSKKISSSSDRTPIKCGSFSPPASRKLPLTSVWSVPFGEQPRCLAVDDKQIALGGENGTCAVFDPQGRPVWHNDFSSPVTALCRLGDDLLAGTQAGKVIRCDVKGKVVWNYQCLFRPERHFWPWWFLPEPSIGALAAGVDPKTGKTYLGVGTGSCSFNVLDAENGTLIADVISPYGFPDKIKSHVIAGTKKQRFFVGHSRLTPSSCVMAWSPHAETMPPLKYTAVCGQDDLHQPHPGWDQCSLAEFHIVSTEQKREEILVLRHGLFNQLAAYDVRTAKPLWMRSLGGSPIAFAITDADSRTGPHITVAEKFGWVSDFSLSGVPIGSQRRMEYILGLGHDAQGRIILWNDKELVVLEKDSASRRAGYSGLSLGWHKMGSREGLMVFRKGKVAFLSPA